MGQNKEREETQCSDVDEKGVRLLNATVRGRENNGTNE